MQSIGRYEDLRKPQFLSLVTLATREGSKGESFLLSSGFTFTSGGCPLLFYQTKITVLMMMILARTSSRFPCGLAEPAISTFQRPLVF